MKIRKSLIFLLLGAIAAVGVKVYQLLGEAKKYAEYVLLAQESSVSQSYKNVFFTSGDALSIVLPILLIICVIAMAVMSLSCKEYPEFSPRIKSPLMGIVCIITVIVTGYTSVMSLLGQSAMEFDGLAGQICVCLGVISMIVMILLAVGFFSGSNEAESKPAVMIVPILWCGMRLGMTFLKFTSMGNINEKGYDLAMLAFMLLFMVSISKFLSGMSENSAKWAFATGGPAVLFSAAATIPRYIMLFIKVGGEQSGIISQNNTDLLNRFGLMPNPTDLCMMIFALGMLFFISSTKAETAEQAQGMQNGQNQYNNQYNNQYGGMYQNPAMMYQQGMQRNMQQNNMMYQQGMQRNMQQNGMMYQQGMQRNMQQNGMMYQQGMQRPMQQNGMMYQQGMQRTMQQNGMGMQNGMMGNPQQRMNPQQTMMRQDPHGRGGRPMRGGTDVYTSRGAGMKVTDQFELRAYGGGIRRFGGLDSFRDQMLTGRSALNVLGAEIPSLANEQQSMEPDTEAMAAAMNASEVTQELESLAEAVQEAVENIPEDNSSAAPAEVQIEGISDDGAMMEDHFDEREYPAAPQRRNISLGSGRYDGRLADRLDEMEDRRRGYGRGHAYEEEEYYDRYGYEEEEYEEDSYDEEYDDYDDYDESDYGEEEYDYEYEDDYDDYDESDDDYYDEEDDDDYYDDEDYDEDYDDDDYYDDDDGYYEE